MRIIPAIDLIDGKCVRLTKGDYATKKVYRHDPLEMAKIFEDHGITNLHLVDLDGAASNQIINHKVLYSISKNTNLKIDFGGGLKSTNDVKIAFENGAKQITGGSIAALNPMLFLEWIEQFGADKIILGADSKSGLIATNGWENTTNFKVEEYIATYVLKGIKTCICTDISRDGMLNGPSLDLYKRILANSAINLIASGGVKGIEDLYNLEKIGCEAVIIGKAIYENKISLKELRNYAEKKNNSLS